MRIAFYCPNKPLSHPEPSGDLVIARSIHAALNRLGHDCSEVVRFRSRWFWKSRRAVAEAIVKLIEGLKQAAAFRPDVWLTYHTYYKSPDVLGPWISRALTIPYVLFQPIYSTRRRRDPGTRVGFYCNHLALKLCRHAFTNNLNDIEGLTRILGRRRITYVPPGIFPDAFQRDEPAGMHIRKLFGIPASTPLLMTAARFRPGAKFESLSYLLRSLSLLKATGQPFMILVAGDGPMEGDLRSMAERLLGDRAVFTGPVDREILYRYYSAADLFVFPGIGESLGMVYLEAQACRLPVVALATAGVPQVVLRDRTGLLVPRDATGEAMAGAVRKLLDDPRARKVMGEEAHRFILEERNLHRNYGVLARKLEEIIARGRALPASG